MKKILFFLTFIFLVISCKERDQDPDILPAATQEGKNTGGAIVNGQVWVAKIEVPDTLPGGNNTYYDTSPLLNTFRLQIVLLKYTDSNSTISFYLERNQDFSPGIYALDNNDNHDNHGSFSPNVLEIFNTNSTNTGTLTITRFDKVNRIVSGTFSFKAVNSAGEVVTITEGRFDRKFL